MPHHVYVCVESVHREIDHSSLIVFLSRGLLGSRSGLRTSDSIVNHLVRNVIQVGLFATIWSLAGLGTYFLLPRNTVYTIFDATSGSIYTHVGGCFLQETC
jgi:hypothetical protein